MIPAHALRPAGMVRSFLVRFSLSYSLPRRKTANVKVLRKKPLRRFLPTVAALRFPPPFGAANRAASSKPARFFRRWRRFAAFLFPTATASLGCGGGSRFLEKENASRPVEEKIAFAAQPALRASWRKCGGLPNQYRLSIEVSYRVRSTLAVDDTAPPQLAEPRQSSWGGRSQGLSFYSRAFRFAMRCPAGYRKQVARPSATARVRQ